MKVALKDYWAIQKKYLSPFKSKVVILGILLLGVTLIQIFSPFIVERYINLATTDDQNINVNQLFQTLKILAAVYTLLTIFQHLLNAISVYFSQDLAWSSTNKLRYDLTKHCMDLDMTFHNEHKPGEMIERIDGDVNALATFLSQFSVIFVSSMLLMFGVLIAIFVKSWKLGLVFTAFTLIAMAIMFALRNFMVKQWEKERQTSSELYGSIEESLSATEDVRANGARKYVMKQFFHYSRKNYKAFRKALLKGQINRISFWGIIAIANTLIFAPTLPMLRRGEINLGMIFLIQMFVGLLMIPIIQLSRQVQVLQQAGASIKRINGIIKIEKKIEDKGKHSLPPGAIELEFKEVNFGYKENEDVLQNVSFNLTPGKSLGIVGHTGSGKTTITRLIFRLYDVQSNKGKIALNGIDIKDVPLKKLRKNISYVTQNIELFQAPLRDNITFFDKRIPDEKIMQIIHEIGLNEWYERLPDGLETTISSGEEGISAGEAQLLALTRAFLKKPNLVILDEASSRLDPATEKLIETAIDKLLLNRTSIIIAHRLATLHRVDQILILDKGQVIEYGDRERLAKDPNSRFFSLLQTGNIEEVLV